jgi:hypothetical protein
MMDIARYRFLSNGTGPCVRLTQQEQDQGWHWCWEWDDMLVGPHMAEAFSCTCGVKNLEEWKNSPEGKKFEEEQFKCEPLDGGTF